MGNSSSEGVAPTMDRTRRLLFWGALGVVALGAALYSTEPPSVDAEFEPRVVEESDKEATTQPTTEASTAASDRAPKSTNKDTRVGRPLGTSASPATNGVSASDQDPETYDDGGLATDYWPLAIGALDFAVQKELDLGDPNYDPRIEAQQAFAPMERDLLAADPLDPAAWKAALKIHRERNLGVSKRAAFLRKSGYPDEATELMTEWSRIYGSWQARAYGRAGPPGYKSPPR